MAGMSAALTIATGGAGQAIGGLVAPAADVGKTLIHYVESAHDYVKNLGRNFEDLEMVESLLSARKKDVKELVNISNEGRSWLVYVEKKLIEVEELRKRYNRVKAAKKTVFYGPSLYRRRLKLSKEIVQLRNSVVELRYEMDTTRACGPAVWEKRRPSRVKQRSCSDIVKVPSQSQHVEDLLELLKNETIKRIGIWGIFGVGKTTILESLYDQVQEKLPSFKNVFWVTASDEIPIDQIQKQILDDQIQKQILDQLRVKTELHHGSEEVARLISESIGNKKYLLLLDNVFSEIDLHRIGIRDNHDYKVILATRERDICRIMNTQEEINVESLSRGDARKLFHDVLGEEAPHKRVGPIAEMVLKQCGGLPHVIRAVGSHLKDSKKESLWKHTLKELQSPTMTQLKHLEDVLKNAFNLIFEGLHGFLKDCLLYAASFPEDHEICREYLIECWMAQEVITNRGTFEEARDEGDTNLHMFIGKCLFDSCTGSKVVKMPIIFRNIALRVADQREFRLLLKNRKESEDPPIESWKNAKVISFIGNGVQLPQEPILCTASILFLQKNEGLSTIPQSFFDYMSALKILDMSGTGITSLPQSISKLTSLKRLYLHDCKKLEQLPDEVERLENLEILDIRGIGVYTLGFPAVIGKLTWLRCLRVSLQSVVGIQNSVAANGTGVYGLGFPDVIGELTWLRWLRVSLQSVVGNHYSVAANGTVATLSSTIQKLFQLEELTIDVVDPKDSNWNTIEPDVVSEVARLQNLSSISFWFSSIGSLETFTQRSISWTRSSSPDNHFRSFNIYVGCEGTHDSPRLDVSECVAQRYLYYYGGKDTPDSIKSVLRWTCAFELIAHDSITYFSDFGTNEMERLEICRVEGCNAMTAFLSSQTPIAPASFTCLRELQLLHLQQLNAICQGHITSDSFKQLRTLTIDHCQNLIELISWKMAEQLCNLQDLKVENCAKVKEIVASGNQSGGKDDVLPKLKTIHLNKLESLVSIHSNDLFKWCKLQSVEINECNKLVNLSLSKTNATNLRWIKCNGNLIKFLSEP